MRTLTPVIMTFSCLVPLILAGCDGKGGTPTDTSTWVDTYVAPVDGDGDGITAGDGDCDDADALIYPGRAEDCDGIDNNCNGVTDEGFADTDGDLTPDCLETEDCDGVDNDGDGDVDEGFSDADGDGVADCVGTESCDGVDNDGDGQIDEGYDADGDGYTQCGSETDAADCDDTDATVYPGASEATGDSVDNDCDGLVDEGAWAAGDLIITEIMNNPTAAGDPYGEWFEVVNDSGRVLVLNGLEITSTTDGDSHQVESNDLIELAPGDYFVFGYEDDTVLNGGTPVDYQYADVSLSNESDEITISAGTVAIDKVTWDDGAAMPDLSGTSMMLDPGYTSNIINDLPTYWCAATEQWSVTSDMGSPGSENELCSTFDHDGDGYSKDEGDCDDANDAVYPGAPEIDVTLDNDCDGDVELMPVASADYDASGSTLDHCDVLYLDGSGSYDGEGDLLTYAWELTSAPTGSARTTADLVTSTDMSPAFYPDVEGEYTFTLTVDDGGTSSYPSSVTVSIGLRESNNSPTADAGADQEGSATASCTAISYGESYSCGDCSDYDFTVDGTGSSDSDGDTIEAYSWSIHEGSSYGTIDDSSASSTTVTVGGIAATYGSTVTQTVIVRLDATDCYGATAADFVNLTVSCTGS
jgi:Putative metal-binding motif/Lamin Tail Domain